MSQTHWHLKTHTHTQRLKVFRTVWHLCVRSWRRGGEVTLRWGRRVSVPAWLHTCYCWAGAAPPKNTQNITGIIHLIPFQLTAWTFGKIPFNEIKPLQQKPCALWLPMFLNISASQCKWVPLIATCSYVFFSITMRDRIYSRYLLIILHVRSCFKTYFMLTVLSCMSESHRCSTSVLDKSSVSSACCISISNVFFLNAAHNLIKTLVFCLFSFVLLLECVSRSK